MFYESIREKLVFKLVLLSLNRKREDDSDTDDDNDDNDDRRINNPFPYAF